MKNIAVDDDAMVELEYMGTMTTPVTVIGEDVVVGFDREKLTRLLGL